mmetsp:Transcript_119863/g.208077  ORF Transcript_119863/g.208077 Transcript_119863/m.208077 type:complete len:217 (+) Transcript_119863:794-1444(+)
MAAHFGFRVCAAGRLLPPPITAARLAVSSSSSNSSSDIKSSWRGAFGPMPAKANIAAARTPALELLAQALSLPSVGSIKAASARLPTTVTAADLTIPSSLAMPFVTTASRQATGAFFPRLAAAVTAYEKVAALESLSMSCASVRDPRRARASHAAPATSVLLFFKDFTRTSVWSSARRLPNTSMAVAFTKASGSSEAKDAIFPESSLAKPPKPPSA